MPRKGDLQPAVRSPEERNALVEANLPLLYHALNQWWALRPVEQLGRREAVSVAGAAMLRCAELWTPERGQFSTLLLCSIRNALNAAVLKQAQAESRIACQIGEHEGWNVLHLAAPRGKSRLEAFERQRFVRRAVRKLPKRMRQVVRWRFFAGRTLREVAARLGLSHERARQLELQALEWLRRLLAETDLAKVG